MTSLAPNTRVRHDRLGPGLVEFDKGLTVLVRFDSGIQECEKAQLLIDRGPIDILRSGQGTPPLSTVARIQAETILSTNDSWGVFSRSSIALLPHQLWVCKRVNESLPTRWLVADDVGLGKTIEAGLILWPLISSGQVRRVLILCPAALVKQWQQRLFQMFDLRVHAYSREEDTAGSHFWQMNDQVVASFHTLRGESGGRQERLLQSEPWDMLLVDEAHHFNHDEVSGPTLTYRLLRRLVDQDRVRSMVFFTGTPHRGKNHAFLSLLELLRPDLFSAKKPFQDQLPDLRQVMIRNNKQNVVNLKGEKLFQPLLVEPVNYAYSPEEAEFYELLTHFILAGEAYAGGLQSSRDQRAIRLVLTAMQKLASSSVAAIRRAIRRRLEARTKTRKLLNSLETALAEIREAETTLDFDRRAELEDELLVLSARLLLLEDEEPRLLQLLEAADRVAQETKITRILEALDMRFEGRSVLFFTEYKATQSLLLSALQANYGEGCSVFINGDDRADEIRGSEGRYRTLRMSRETATEKFNQGQARFLVATEAGGEGIDLQERCHSLVHVDLPWNPMRLHQRVGRLNRYGQRQRVEVLLMRNPDNVDSKIWGILDEKLTHINAAFREAMDDPEDMKELVLGMAGAAFFEGLFAEGTRQNLDEAGLREWFDARTSTFGGDSALDTVRALVGHSARFDYQQVCQDLPRVDLPALEPFLLNMLELNHRRLTRSELGLSFKTPDLWRKAGVRDVSSNLHFRRGASSGRIDSGLLGVGHPLLDGALEQARQSGACVASVEGLQSPLVIFRTYDRVTVDPRMVRAVVVAVELSPEGPVLKKDWELLEQLNRLSTLEREERSVVLAVAKIETAEAFLRERLGSLGLPFRLPELELLGVLCAEDVASGDR